MSSSNMTTPLPYNVVLRGTSPSFTALVMMPNHLVGRCLVQLSSFYLQAYTAGGGPYEVRIDWGASSPYGWDASPQTGQPGTTILASTAVSHQAASVVRDIPQGPAECRVQIYDLTTGALATFSNETVVLQLQVTPAA